MRATEKSRRRRISLIKSLIKSLPPSSAGLTAYWAGVGEQRRPLAKRLMAATTSIIVSVLENLIQPMRQPDSMCVFDNDSNVTTGTFVSWAKTAAAVGGVSKHNSR